MGKQKKAFTLIEMMIVIALIGLTFGSIAIQVPKALRGESFENAIDLVKGKITTAQELMLHYQTDIALILEPKTEGTYCYFVPAKPLPEKLLEAFNRHQPIKEIEEVAWNGTFTQRLELCYDGTLGVTPKGTLVLRGREKEAVLSLKGFPTSVLRGEYEETIAETSYPETILSFI